MKRVFIIVLDSVGAGALPDAQLYGHRNDVDGYAQALSRFDGFYRSLQKSCAQTIC